MKIINQTKNSVLAEDAMVANTTFTRIKGLLGRKEFPKGQALILKPCNSIHTLFMRFPIDVIFFDQNNKIVRAISGLRPWRLSGIYFPAQSCIELPEGVVASSFSSPGDFLSFSD